jgi:hypothetical protein
MEITRFVRARLWLFSIFLVASGYVWLGSAGRASAGLITYTMTVGTDHQIGVLPQFDPNLGILTEVTFSAAGSIGEELVIQDTPVTSLTLSGTTYFDGDTSYSSTIMPLGGENVSPSTITFNPPLTSSYEAWVSFAFLQTITTGLSFFYGTGDV